MQTNRYRLVIIFYRVYLILESRLSPKTRSSFRVILMFSSEPGTILTLSPKYSTNDPSSVP